MSCDRGGPAALDSSGAAPRRTVGGVKEFLVYTALRLGLMVAAFALVGGLWALVAGPGEVNWLLVIVLAAVLSAVGSWQLLARQRDDFARVVSERAGRASEALERSRSKEDLD